MCFFSKVFFLKCFFRESQMSLWNSTKFCTEVRKVTKKKERTRALKKKKKLLANTIPFQNLQKLYPRRHRPPQKRESKRQQWCQSRTAQKLQWYYERKIRTIFNEITRLENFTPKSWRKIRIQVSYKKGDREDAGNYRPICSLPVWNKLFATVLYARLASTLHKVQPPGQGGFRPNHRTDDHLMVYRMLEQRCREWRVLLYISTIDFTIWSSLQYYGVEPGYVRLLRRLYSQQEGTVLTDKESDVFLIKRWNEAGRSTVLLTLQHSVAISH